MGRQGGPHESADPNAAQRDAQGKPPFLNKPSLNGAQGERPEDAGTYRGDGIKCVELCKALDPAAHHVTQSDAERSREQRNSGDEAIRGPPDEETGNDIDKDVKRLHGRGEGVTPPKGLLQGFEKNAEDVKGALGGTTNEASPHDHPAIEKSIVSHFSSLTSSFLQRQSPSMILCVTKFWDFS